MTAAGAMNAALRPDEPRAAGRMCPLDYRYAPAALDRPADIRADTVYVVGGLYGNLAALAAVEALAASEPAPPTIVFNGDFHWFDADADWFADVERGVAHHQALRGNVETEIARVDDIGAGCGCAYPESVEADVVNRSNAILAELRDVAERLPGVRTRFAVLPMHLVAEVGRLRIGIVHGDAASLAGWRFAPEALDHTSARSWLAEVKAASRIDVFASTHTCMAALRAFELPDGRLTVINNGAAGMPNFAGSRAGLISRISTRPPPVAPLYGVARDGVHIDALALDYDSAAFESRFLVRWGEGSPARLSYYRRIIAGPDYTVAQAYPPGSHGAGSHGAGSRGGGSRGGGD